MTLKLSDEEIFNLVVDEYRDQERVRQALFDRLRAMVALSTIVLAASAATLGTGVRSPPPDYVWFVNWLAAATTWLCVVIELIILAVTQGPTHYAEVTSVLPFVEYEGGRISQLVEAGYNKHAATKICRVEVSKKLLQNYANCESVNRAQNQRRQRWQSYGTRFLIAGACALLIEAAAFLTITISR